MASYAVIWREGRGPTFAGKLEFEAAALVLEGRSSGGAESRQTVGYDELAHVALSHNGDSRIEGRRAVLIDRIRGARLAIASLQPATLSELGEKLHAALASR
jgi:hypothetical protein